MIAGFSGHLFPDDLLYVAGAKKAVIEGSSRKMISRPSQTPGMIILQDRNSGPLFSAEHSISPGREKGCRAGRFQGSSSGSPGMSHKIHANLPGLISILNANRARFPVNDG